MNNERFDSQESDLNEEKRKFTREGLREEVRRVFNMAINLNDVERLTREWLEKAGVPFDKVIAFRDYEGKWVVSIGLDASILKGEGKGPTEISVDEERPYEPEEHP